MQFSSFDTALNKHIYLRSIQDNNETLFYRLLHDHLEEMMPIIYTPTVGDACEKFSDIYRTERGLFISYSEKDHIDDVLHNATKRNVKIIVVTDGERILGLGDQGIGGMGIPIGKLSLYSVCGGISPAYTLPIVLDVGTNNQKLLDDTRYMGWRHKRINQEQYNEFVDAFMRALKRRWPEALLQFEDFAQPNAMPLLRRYRKDACCFNDDIQGTAAVTVGTLMAACRVKNVKLSDQNVVFVGSGSAGCGIAEQIIQQMINEGASEKQARALRDFQKKLCQKTQDIAHWTYSSPLPSLRDVVNLAKPGVLIGVSGTPGLFTEPVIKAMHSNCPNPIIFPLSNPIKQIEAKPKDIIEWTNGDVIIG